MRVYAPVYYPVDRFTLSTPSFPELSIGCRDTRVAASLSADRGENDREIFATFRHVPDAYRTMVASERVVATVGFRYGPRPVASSSSASSAYPTAVRERSVGRSVGRSVRPAGILTHVGSVLRQRGGGFSCPSRLLLLRHLVLHPRDALPLSATELPARSPPPLPLSPCHRFPVLLSLRHLRRYTSCSSALFCLLFMSLPVPLPLSATLPPPRRRRRRLLLRLLLAFPTCRVDLVASPPPRRPGSAVHQ